MVPLVAAIAAGNCVILKPSEKTPATAAFLGTLIREVFDECEVAVFEGGPSLAEELLELPFDHIFFTGSTRVGRLVMAAAAKNLASVTLELGGKSPAVVDPSADLTAAAHSIAWGRLLNAGQTCLAPDHVWVHESVERELLARLQSAVTTFYGASEEARQKSPDFARVVDADSFARLEGLVARTVSQGATVELGGRFDAASRYVSPTVLSGVTAQSAIMEDEIFGPVLPVLRYRDRDEVYREVERTGKPLVLYVFGRRRRAVEEILSNIASGGAVVNNVFLAWGNPNLPFGGVGPSGLGSYHGVFGFRAFSHERAVTAQRWPALTRMLFPPYGDRRSRLTARVIKALE
jgi:aldehyde dehydrogenase (NAD+)